MERIDKIISSQGKYTRKEVKKLITQKRVKLNNEIVLKSDIKIDPDISEIYIDGIKLCIKKYLYLVLNKPKGYVSATEDNNQNTVLDLIPSEFNRKGLFPAGRLDLDTTGLMLITDDGIFAHNILSPKKHIKKSYEVEIDINVTEEMVKGFENGVQLNDHKCKPAKLNITGNNTAIVTISEGRYHQIKRMFGCFGAKVLNLHRISMGNFYLPNDLKEGCCRELTLKELNMIQEKDDNE